MDVYGDKIFDKLINSRGKGLVIGHRMEFLKKEVLDEVSLEDFEEAANGGYIGNGANVYIPGPAIYSTFYSGVLTDFNGVIKREGDTLRMVYFDNDRPN